MTNSEVFERGGCVVRPDRRLGEIVQRKPPGITGHQWTTASRALLDFVARDSATGAPVFAVAFADPAGSTPDNRRADRMIKAVCEVAGLGLLWIESPALRPDRHGRKIVEYVLDARAFDSALDRDLPADALDDRPLSYREIVGRLPDGRNGFVNDLGALARAAAIDAYAGRRLTDPILRGLHMHWRDGSAEGWGWLDVRDGWCLFERVALRTHRFSCGVRPGRLAEDLAAMAIGERLKALDEADVPLHDKARLRQDIDGLRLRRADMTELSDIDHISC